MGGNVRELRGVRERAAVTCQAGEIRLEDLSAEFRRPVPKAPGLSPARRVREVSEEKGLIEAALRDTCGNRSRAAMLLGISRITLWKKKCRLGMAPVDTGRRADGTTS